MKTIHYIMLAFGALAAGLPQLETAFPSPALPYIRAAAAVCVLLTSVLGVISPSATAAKSA